MSSKQWASELYDAQGYDNAQKIAKQGSVKWYRESGKRTERNPNWQFFYEASKWLEKIHVKRKVKK